MYIVKNISEFIILLVCALNICVINDMTDLQDEEEDFSVTLPNGVTVDARIPEDVIDMILRRFEAIENGDIAAFRAALGEMEDGVSYNYQLQLIYTFFGDFFDIDPGVFQDAMSNGGEEITEIADALFYGEHPPESRNTGLIVKRIEFSPDGGLAVKALNNKNEELDYHFLYY